MADEFCAEADFDTCMEKALDGIMLKAKKDPELRGKPIVVITRVMKSGQACSYFFHLLLEKGSGWENHKQEIWNAGKVDHHAVRARMAQAAKEAVEGLKETQIIWWARTQNI